MMAPTPRGASCEWALACPCWVGRRRGGIAIPAHVVDRLCRLRLATRAARCGETWMEELGRSGGEDGGTAGTAQPGTAESYARPASADNRDGAGRPCHKAPPMAAIDNPQAQP